MDIGTAVPNEAINFGVTIPILVWVGLTRKVNVATGRTGFWSVIWVGELELFGKLQAEKTVTNEMNIIRSLNVFIIVLYDQDEVTTDQGKKKVNATIRIKTINHVGNNLSIEDISHPIFCR